MVKKRVRKKSKRFGKRKNLKIKTVGKKARTFKKIKKSIARPIKKEKKGFFQRLFRKDNSSEKKRVEKINQSKEPKRKTETDKGMNVQKQINEKNNQLNLKTLLKKEMDIDKKISRKFLKDNKKREENGQIIKKKYSNEKMGNLSGKNLKFKPSINQKSVKKNHKRILKKSENQNSHKGFFEKLFGINVEKKQKKINRSENKKVLNNFKKGFSEKKAGDLKRGNPRENFMRTGIKGFDSLFEKNMGIPNGNSVLIEGGPGSGKTIFCLATLNELCKKGKKCLYMSFEESEEQLIAHMEELGWNPKEFIKKGLLRIERFDAIDISRSIEALLSAAKKELLIEVEPMFFPEDFKSDFVIIDSLTSIASAFTGEESRFRIYMEQLFRYLEKNNITNFLIREVSSPSHVGTTFKEQGEAVSFLSDGIIVLYNVVYDSGKRAFAIEILKMRGVSFKHQIVELKILNKKGLEVNANKILKKSGKNNFSLT